MSLVTSKNRKIEIIDILIFLILFLSSSFVVTRNIVTSFFSIGLWVLTLVILLYQCERKIKLRILIFFSVLAINVVLTDIVNGEDLIAGGKVIFGFGVAALFASTFSFEEFRTSYIKVMKFLSIVSLVGLGLYIVIPQLFSFLPKENGQYAYMGLYTVALGYYRNFGMFWEPGAYQTFLSIALLFELISSNRNGKTIALFIITLVTTTSTTAYFALGLLLILFYLENNYNTSKTRITVAIVLIAVVTFLYFNQDILFGDHGGAVFGKLARFYENYTSGRSETSSTSVRFYAITQPLIAFLRKPILGNGHVGLSRYTYEYTMGMNTCTFVNWFAVYGLLFGITMISGFVSISRKLGSKKYTRFLIFVIFFLITISENFVNGPIMIMLALYGLSLEKKDAYR